MSRFSERYSGFDRFQQRHPWLGFPLAVLQKYSDDQGGYLAAMITYYGFFAIFPLLLVLYGHLYKGARRQAAIALESHVLGASKNSAVRRTYDGPQVW